MTPPWSEKTLGTGRALGIAGYLSLSALVALGLWVRHPWRLRARIGHSETLLRAHATLGMATLVVILGHLAFLATDRYAGVGWLGAIVPGRSHYRPAAIGLGAASFELLVAIFVTARFAGWGGTRHWMSVHRLGLATFVLAWFHGVLSGADAVVVRLVYAPSACPVRFAVLGTPAARLLAGPCLRGGAESYVRHRDRLGKVPIAEISAAGLRTMIARSGLLGTARGGDVRAHAGRGEGGFWSEPTCESFTSVVNAHHMALQHTALVEQTSGSTLREGTNRCKGTKRTDKKCGNKTSHGKESCGWPAMVPPMRHKVASLNAITGSDASAG